MEENPDNEDANFMSDWSGSMTPPLSDMEDELPVSQCVSPVRSEYLHQLDVTSAADCKYDFCLILISPKREKGNRAGGC